MGGGTPNYTSVLQPSYGEGMREALEAQVALLTGSKVGEDGADFRSIRDELGLKEGSNLMEELVKRYEAPLRKTTAQVDTDILRQTILGDETRSTYQADGRIIEGYETPSGPAGEGTYRLELTSNEVPNNTGGIDLQRSREGYRLINDKGMTVLEKSTTRYDNRQEQTRERVEDAFKEEAIEKGFIRDPQQWTDITSSDFPDKYLINPGSGKLEESQPVYKKNEDGTDFIAEPGTFKAGETIRSGTGMVDLVGDTRGVQKSVRSEDYGSYVRSDDARMEAFKAENARLAELGEAPLSMEQWGQSHYEQMGKAAGDAMPTSYSLQDAGRQAGFDESGEFRGLSALAEDIGRGSQQRAREADIADVERLGGRATDAYRAQGDLSGALAQARGLGAGGAQGLSAIPSDPLFEGAATDTLADRTRAENLGITAITGGRTGDYDPRAAAQGLQPGFQGPVQPGQQAQYAQPGGTDAFRSALMQQGMGALDQGLSERENRAVQEAARARSTNMGRTFDQTASIDESRAVIEEDNARRMQNRAFAQSALGQEVGIQQADMARGLQAQQMELGRQSAGVDRQLTAEEKDIERIMRQQAMQEQYRQQGLGAERANAAQMVGLEQATSADPFQAILQRQGQNNLASGGALFGQAGYGLDSGPQYLNPESGLGFISNQATNAANMYGAQIGADATRSAGMFGGLGALGGGLLGGIFG